MFYFFHFLSGPFRLTDMKKDTVVDMAGDILDKNTMDFKNKSLSKKLYEYILQNSRMR